MSLFTFITTVLITIMLVIAVLLLGIVDDEDN